MTHQRSPNFSLPFVSRWLFVSRLDGFCCMQKLYEKPCDLNFISDKVTTVDHCDTAMQQWLVDRLTLTIWGHCVWASESGSAFGQFLDRRDPTDAPDQCLWMCVKDCEGRYRYVLAVTAFWTSDFCQGDLAPVVAEELKQVGKMRVKTKTTQWNT